MRMEAELSWRLQWRNRSLLCERYTHEAVAIIEELPRRREHAWKLVPNHASPISYHCSCTKPRVVLFAMAEVKVW
ncbi:hypothetical protein LEMLEM_LOCUS11177, partial [Lemmus lemmus]